MLLNKTCFYKLKMTFIGTYERIIRSLRLYFPYSMKDLLKADTLHLYYEKETIDDKVLPFVIGTIVPLPITGEHELIPISHQSYQRKNSTFSYSFIKTPKNMLEHLAAEGSLILFGCGDYFEIWRPDNYKLIQDDCTRDASTRYQSIDLSF